MFESQRRVADRRKKYPRKCVDALIGWMVDDGKQVAAAARELLHAEASGSIPDFSATRQMLVESKDDLLRAAEVAQCMTGYSSLIHTFIGDSDLVVLEDEDDDISKACQRHKDWFDALTRATRTTTSSTVTLENLFKEKWLGAGVASSDTAVSLTEAWAAVENALDAEMGILADTSPLRALHCCAQVTIALAGKLKDHLSKAKDDFRSLSSLGLCMKHCLLFPELLDEDDFLNHLEEVTGLPISFDSGVDDHGARRVVEVSADSIPDFKKLSRSWQALSQRGVAIPRFVVQYYQLCAKYDLPGINLKAFGKEHEVTLFDRARKQHVRLRVLDAGARTDDDAFARFLRLLGGDKEATGGAVVNLRELDEHLEVTEGG